MPDLNLDQHFCGVGDGLVANGGAGGEMVESGGR